MTALVDPPIAPLTRIAFSKASRVRIFEMRTSSLDHLDDAPAGQVRERVAARVDGRNRRVVRQAQAERLDHRRHRRRRAHDHAGPAERDMHDFGLA